MERAIHAGAHNPRANGMICWVLQHRGHFMVDTRMVKRRHWLWDRIHHEITGQWPNEGEEEGDSAP